MINFWGLSYGELCTRGFYPVFVFCIKQIRLKIRNIKLQHLFFLLCDSENVKSPQQDFVKQKISQYRFEDALCAVRKDLIINNKISVSSK